MSEQIPDECNLTLSDHFEVITTLEVKRSESDLLRFSLFGTTNSSWVAQSQ